MITLLSLQSMRVCVYACIYVISATSSPSSKGDVPSVTESKDTKSVNLDGGRCSRLGYLPEGIANCL